MTQILDAFDSFTSWTVAGASTVTENFYQSPVTLLQTAAKFHLDPGEPITIYRTGIPNDADVYFSVWLRCLSNTTVQRSLGLRDGSSIDTDLAIGSDWFKHVAYYNALSGSSTPYLAFNNPGLSAIDVQVSYAAAGLRDLAFETAAKKPFPLNTTGLFELIGENNV
jgi:hypothetical protein